MWIDVEPLWERQRIQTRMKKIINSKIKLIKTKLTKKGKNFKKTNRQQISYRVCKCSGKETEHICELVFVEREKKWK